MEYNASTLALNRTHGSRYKHSPTTYKQKEIKGDYIPPMTDRLTEKYKCKQIASVAERR